MNIPRFLVALVPFAVAGCAQDPAAQPTDHVITLHAAGVQVYECRRAADRTGGTEWQLAGPEADLYDDAGQRAGRHFAGPTWEARDGSWVKAAVVKRLDGPKSPDSVPALLLAAKSASASGAFAGVTTIQRRDTVGGAAPQGGCGASQVGTSARVPYAATYVFTAAQRPAL